MDTPNTTPRASRKKKSKALKPRPTAQSARDHADHLMSPVPVLVSRRDDLVKIEGIDPTTEMALNSIGIRQFSDFRDYTPETLAHALRERAGLSITAETIAQQDWMGWAELLAAENDSAVTLAAEAEKTSAEVTANTHWQEEELDAAETIEQQPQLVPGVEDQSKGEPAPERTSRQEEEHAAIRSEEDERPLHIQNVRFAQVAAPEAADRPSAKRLRSEIHCELTGAKVTAMTLDQIPLCVQIHAADTITGEHVLLASQTGRLQPDQTQYRMQLEFKVPGTGRYQLFVIAFLLQANLPISLYRGPNLRVIP